MNKQIMSAVLLCVAMSVISPNALGALGDQGWTGYTKIDWMQESIANLTKDEDTRARGGHFRQFRQRLSQLGAY